MKIVAVTGASGFVGSHLCTYLDRHERKVKAIVRDPEINLPGADKICINEITSNDAISRY